MYREITDGIEVRVEPNYAPERSAPDSGLWFWTYEVEIRNHGDEPVQLIARHWEITDGQGRVQHVRGDGVVGEQPLIRPGQSFQYTSGCPLRTESGFMRGEYEMADAGGRPFQVRIPAFSLDCPRAERPLH